MRHEKPRPRVQAAPDESHPWKQRASAQIAERAAKTKGDKLPRKHGWNCPGCGSVSCDFGECQGGDY